MLNGKKFDLCQLIEAVGEGEDLNKMLAIFTDSTPKILNELNNSYAEFDIDGIADSAHKLKATIDMLRIAELQKVIREMDNKLAANKNQHKLPQLISKTNTVMNQVLSEIQLTYLAEKKV
jgi:HPt (histidine-containing phosphotransfer) domain-containing protein